MRVCVYLKSFMGKLKINKVIIAEMPLNLSLESAMKCTCLKLYKLTLQGCDNFIVV